MPASLRGDGATGLVELLTTVPKSLKEKEMVFLRRPSLDLSSWDKPCGVGGNPVVQQGQHITAGTSVLTGIQQKAKGKTTPKVAGHTKQSICIHLLPIDRLAEVNQALPTPHQQRHVSLKESKVIKGAANRHVQLSEVLPIGLLTKLLRQHRAAFQPYPPEPQSTPGHARVLQAKNQIGLCDEGIRAPAEIEVSTLREGTKDLIALMKVTRA